MDLSETKACHCLAARKAARTISRIYDEKLRAHGLRSTQFSLLAALAQRGPSRQGELAELLGVERTTLTRSAALLERQAWIEPAGGEDARERRLRLTAAGRRKLERAYPAWKEAQERVERERGARGVAERFVQETAG
ncbi:MAG TPA: MarR family transcriptional regulator [Candidatus Thermoplasmatota archaeon]|nr:MarR family transcriptional regulator [Candidatus Thermoplasmatota archaeon]